MLFAEGDLWATTSHKPQGSLSGLPNKPRVEGTSAEPGSGAFKTHQFGYKLCVIFLNGVIARETAAQNSQADDVTED